MKLYREEQLREAIELARKKYAKDIILTTKGIMHQFTPIELPNDEEIENRIKTHNPYPKQKQMHIDWANGFERGAQWVLDKIQGDNQ